MLIYVHSSFIHNSPHKQPRCLPTKEWIKKMWYICRMNYYSAVKNKIMMKYSDKWMELEKKMILSEVTQTQKDKHGRYSLISGY